MCGILARRGLQLSKAATPVVHRRLASAFDLALEHLQQLGSGPLHKSWASRPLLPLQFVFLELCKERAAMLAEGMRPRPPTVAEAVALMRAGKATPFSVVYAW